MSERSHDVLPAPNAAMLLACGAALTTLVPVALHQLGALEHLPDPPGALFDSDGITESKTAHPLGVPDGLLGLASYGITLALMLAAKENATARRLSAAKLAVDGGMAGFNLVRQVVQFRKLCSWCTGTALATGAMVFAAWPLLRTAGQEAVCSVTREEP